MSDLRELVHIGVGGVLIGLSLLGRRVLAYWRLTLVGAVETHGIAALSVWEVLRQRDGRGVRLSTAGQDP